MKLIWRSLALALVATVLVVPAAATGAPRHHKGSKPSHRKHPAAATVKPVAAALPLGHAGRWITDADGRVAMLHGINMVYKIKPFYPSASGFGNDDAVFLQSIGFNAVRVGVLWEAVEPQPGVYDDAYLAHIAQTVKMLARHGIVSLLDFHQDQYNEEFQGEGFPSWAVQDDGLPAQPQLGFGGDYLGMPALWRAFDHFWANSPGPGGVGLQDRYAAAWGHVAQIFKSNKNVLGYELMNEPWPGSVWPACASTSGCPSFDKNVLTPFYEKVDRAIRTADPRTLVWYEPNVIFNDGPATDAGPIGDARAGFAFHDYCLTEPYTGSPQGCQTFDDLVFQNAVSHVQQTGDALMETEFGATNDIPYLDAEVQRADKFMTPWLEWAYCGCNDPTTSGPGTKQAIVVNPEKPPTGSNLVMPTLKALVEPYPQLISGTPQAWAFDVTNRVFTFRYSTTRPTGKGTFKPYALTNIAAPALVYGGHYQAIVAGGAIVSKAGAPTLEIAACPDADTIGVTINPSGRNRSSCKVPARHRRKQKRGKRRRHQR
jgi:endoglycosylceramidase